MNWEPLDLSKASAIKKEVDSVVANFEIVSGDGRDGNFLPMLQSIQTRIQELEIFCTVNCEDDRTILFEKQRLRLRKLIQTYGPININNSSVQSVHGSLSGTNSIRGSRSGTPPQTPSIAHSSSVNMGQITPNLNFQLLHISENNMNGSVNNSTAVTPRSVLSSQKRVPLQRPTSEQRQRTSQQPIQQPSASKIYAWESTGSDKPQSQKRVPIEVDGVVFEPTSTDGFYSRSRHHHRDEEDVSEGELISEHTAFNGKYIDFQVLLTAEELTTLAARKRAERKDIKHDKSLAASSSMLTAVPYIEPNRVRETLFRPDQPDKWIK